MITVYVEINFRWCNIFVGVFNQQSTKLKHMEICVQQIFVVTHSDRVGKTYIIADR